LDNQGREKKKKKGKKPPKISRLSVGKKPLSGSLHNPQQAAAPTSFRPEKREGEGKKEKGGRRRSCPLALSQKSNNALTSVTQGTQFFYLICRYVRERREKGGRRKRGERGNYNSFPYLFPSVRNYTVVLNRLIKNKY